MRIVQRLLAVVLLVLFAASGTALADHLDPKKRLTSADQKRAKAMLLRNADLPGYGRQPIYSYAHVTCRSLDDSDLTLTGEARTPQWVLGPTTVSGESQVYESESDANASWKRFTSPAGFRCLELELRREYKQQGVTLLSFRKIAFPRMSQRTAAYRVTLSGQVQGQTIRVEGDLIALAHSRAHVGLVFGSALVSPDRATEASLTRIVARRMATAMRG